MEGRDVDHADVAPHQPPAEGEEQQAAEPAIDDDNGERGSDERVVPPSHEEEEEASDEAGQLQEAVVVVVHHEEVSPEGAASHTTNYSPAEIEGAEEGGERAHDQAPEAQREDEEELREQPHLDVVAAGGEEAEAEHDDDEATFDPEEGYEREKLLRAHDRAASDADLHQPEPEPVPEPEVQHEEEGEAAVVALDHDATSSQADHGGVPPSIVVVESEGEVAQRADEPPIDGGGAAAHDPPGPDAIPNAELQPIQEHQPQQQQNEAKDSVADHAAAAIEAITMSHQMNGGSAAAAVAASAAKPADGNTSKKKGGLSGLLSFAYSPRGFGGGAMGKSATTIAAAADSSSANGGAGGLSPRRALSSSAPHPPLLHSPRMMVLPSPPPPLHLPKPTPPLGSSVGLDKEPQVILVQKCWRRKVARRKIHELVMHSRARFKVAEEIAVTEKNYVDILHTIIEVFMEPLAKQLPGWIAEQSKAKKVKGAPDALDPALVEIMFGNVKELYKMHKPFAEALQHAIKNWYPYRRMGVLFMDVLLRMNGFLVEYGKYVNGYGTAIKYWNQAMRNPSFARFINTALDNPRCAHLDFCSLIINPVQRVPRYALLLRDIQKHTWAGHGDEESVAHALDKIHIVAEYVNEAKRAAEGMERTTYLQDHIDDKKLAVSLAQPQRKYIREGPLKLVHRSDFKDRHVILFNDIIVITVSKSSGKTTPRLPPSALPTELCVKGTIELKHTIEAKPLDKPERGLQLTVHGKTTKWQAASVKDRDEWLRDLQSLTSRP